MKLLSSHQCSVAQGVEIFGLSSKPSNKADSCVNKLACFHTCSVYLLYFLAMTLKINNCGSADPLLKICDLYIYSLLALTQIVNKEQF